MYEYNDRPDACGTGGIPRSYEYNGLVRKVKIKILPKFVFKISTNIYTNFHSHMGLLQF
jgi:hypothetical protein